MARSVTRGMDDIDLQAGQAETGPVYEIDIARGWANIEIHLRGSKKSCQLLFGCQREKHIVGMKVNLYSGRSGERSGASQVVDVSVGDHGSHRNQLMFAE